MLFAQSWRCLNHSQVRGLCLYPVASIQISTFASSDMGGEHAKIPSYILTHPFLVGSGTATPQHETSKRGTSKRKQILVNLLDALNELANDEETFPKGKPPTRLQYSHPD